MRVEKIKDILKSKRTLIISTVLVGAVAVVTAGTMILHNKNIENNNVAIEKNIEDKISEDDVLEEINEELEVENTVESTEEHVHDENCNHDEENSTSQENNQVVQNNSSSTNKQEEINQNNSDKKVSTTTQTSTNNSNKDDTTSNSNSNTNKNEHTHSWVEVYKDIYHDEEGHYENVLIKEAWTETVPIYETKIVNICNGCGQDITGNEREHMKSAALAGNMQCGGWHNEQRQVQTGTKTITHDAVYEQKWIVDKAAWTEKVLSGYKCSSCGATK